MGGWWGWESGKGRRLVTLGRWKRWHGGEVEMVEKVTGWWDGKVGGFWFYSRVGDAEWVQDFIFLFLILIKGTKRPDGFKLFCMAPRMERLLLHLPQAFRNKVYALEVGCGCFWNLQLQGDLRWKWNVMTLKFEVGASNEKSYLQWSVNLACGFLLVLRRLETEGISYWWLG